MTTETTGATGSPGHGQELETGSDDAPRQLALHDLHASLGAKWGADSGVRLPLHYGDPAAEREAVETGVGLWDASGCDRLELLGADRHRFLNGMMTADVGALEAGRCLYGLFTNVKGRILADATLMAHEDRLWVRLPATTGAAIREHLSRFIIADQVEIRPLADMVPLALVGPGAPDVVARRVDALPEPGEHRKVDLDGTEACLARESRFGVPAFSLWVSASLAPGLASALLAADDAPALVGFEAIEGARIERSIPRFGREIGPDTFPQEAGVDLAVSYTKGCYLGQEVVARIHYRGGVQRQLRQLEIASTEPEAGQAISHDGREAGRLTSVAGRFAGDGWLGLAILANRAAEPGTVVELEGGGEATVLAAADQRAMGL